MSSASQYWSKSVPWSFKEEGLTYEERRRMRYDLQDYMLDLIPFKEWKRKQVLEVGCGAGIDSAEFARNGSFVTAVDFAEESVKRTTETFREAGLTASILLRAADNTGLPDKSFDAVYSFGVLHHIPNVEDVLREIARVLRPAGEGVFMVYNKDSLLNAYSILFLHRNEGKDEQELATKYSERTLGNPYTKLYSSEEAQDLFELYFRDVRVETTFSVIDTAYKRKVKVDAPKELGWHLLIFCKNPIHSMHRKT